MLAMNTALQIFPELINMEIRWMLSVENSSGTLKSNQFENIFIS